MTTEAEVKVRERFEDAACLALKMEGGPMSQGIQVCPEVDEGKKKKKISSRASRKNTACDILASAEGDPL